MMAIGVLLLMLADRLGKEIGPPVGEAADDSTLRDDEAAGGECESAVGS